MSLCRCADKKINLQLKSHEKVDFFVRFVYNNSVIKAKGVLTMSITATELKQNLGRYLLMAATEDVFITKNGKVVAKLSNPNQDRVNMAKSLFGVLPQDITLEEAKNERIDTI